MAQVKDLNLELKRKILHLSSIWVAVLPLFIGSLGAGIVFLFIASFLLLLDLFRINKLTSFDRIVNAISFVDLNKLYRKSEENRLSGATNMGLSALICNILFSPEVFALAFSVLIVSDSFAAIIGKQYGKRKIVGDKTFEGLASFYIFGSLIVAVFVDAFSLHATLALLALVCASVTELYSSKIRLDDNLTIPVVFGIVYSSFALLF